VFVLIPVTIIGVPATEIAETDGDVMITITGTTTVAAIIGEIGDAVAITSTETKRYGFPDIGNTLVIVMDEPSRHGSKVGTNGEKLKYGFHPETGEVVIVTNSNPLSGNSPEGEFFETLSFRVFKSSPTPLR
jgi:hypothetical protein